MKAQEATGGPWRPQAAPGGPIIPEPSCTCLELSPLANARDSLMRHRRRLLEGRRRGNESGRVRRHSAHQNAEPAVVGRGPRAEGAERKLHGERH